MLTRHIAKTALPHLTSSRVICNHHHLRSLHHTPSRHITTPTQIVEPTLNWRPGIDSESQIEPLKRGRGRPRKHPVPEEDTAKRGRGRPRKHPVSEEEDTAKLGRGRPRKHPVSEEEDTAKLGRRPRKPPGTEDVRVKPQGEYLEETPGIEQGYLPRRPVIEEPVLNWVSGHRTRDIHKAIQSSGPDLSDLEDPKLHWLASHREGHEPRPAWQGSIRGRLDADPVTLLKLASLELTRRRRIRIAEPEKNPITRYPLFEKRPTSGKKLARKVISNIRNASDHLNLSEPVITVGTARWTAENPRRVPEARLRVESFEELFGRGDNHHQEEAMDGSSVDASEITMAMEEPVPNDTNIEMPSPNDAPTGATSAPEAASNPDLKRIHDSSSSKVEGGPNKKKRVAKRKPMKEGGAEEVLGYDIKSLLATFNITEKDIAPGILPEYQSTLELTIADISSSGDGLAVHNNRVYCVPYTLPGDKVEAIVKNHQESHTMAELIKVITPSPDRDDSLINCKYFAACSGCQFQMLPYEKQLEQKRRTVQKAFTNFSDLPTELIPDVLPTMGSPLQYGYRTKLTPHFNGPRRGGFKPGFPPPNIGFMSKMGKYTIDIEDCPIGTDAVREGLKIQREWVKNNLHTYKRGATLLLRESTNRVPIEEPVENDGEKYVETKKYITNSNQRSIEYFGDFRFNSPAGSFFQNNNSILESFTDYIRDNLNLPVVKPTSDTNTTIETTAPKYLVDAYCGSGLFTVACGQGLEKVIGVDIDKNSIASARDNAKTNNIKNATFIEGNAEAIFAKINFPGAETSLIIDPPRKGCDKVFLDQLLDFAPKRVVYVSCNTHTQARDIGYILRDERGGKYRVDSIKGFDFFPQTHHVEGVAVLTRAD